MVILLSFTTTYSWSFVLLTDLRLHKESWELSYIVKHGKSLFPIDSFIISDLKAYFVFPVCVSFLGFSLLISARHFSYVQLDHKVVAKFWDKCISG